MKEPDTYILLATVIDICMYQSEFFFFGASRFTTVIVLKGRGF